MPDSTAGRGQRDLGASFQWEVDVHASLGSLKGAVGFLQLFTHKVPVSLIERRVYHLAGFRAFGVNYRLGGCSDINVIVCARPVVLISFTEKPLKSNSD